MFTAKESPPLAAKKETGKRSPEPVALATGGIAALLAGACCVGPLVLAGVGLGGAWLAHLRLLEPYRPWFIGIAIAMLGFAGWRIYRPAAAECKAGESCAAPQVRRRYKIGFWIVAALLAVTFGFPYFVTLFL